MINPPLIDSHAHVWDRGCTFIAGARYQPDYEATIESYLRVLDDHGIEKAVLVQPSFLGTDNSYLLSALRTHPDRLRGIVVLSDDTTENELDDLSDRGVIGHRFNLIGHDAESLAGRTEVSLIHAITARGWWSEVQAAGAFWPMLLEVLQGCDARIMVDHFGKPTGPDCPGHKVLISTDPTDLCVKLSAPYRQSPDDMRPHARAFLETWGAERCLWGSDWPWTQNEHRHSFADTLAWLDDWTSPEDRAAMHSAASGLCGFRG
ncbi:MAG: amidohydrolase family protein [Pseudomonadota bacterium]